MRPRFHRGTIATLFAQSSSAWSAWRNTRGASRRAQPLTPRAPKGNPLADRLADNEAVLLHAYRTVAKAMGEDRAITPAAEWLIDNYHVVERQIREIRSDLPPGYYRQLPKLAEGPFAGYPRVFGVAWAFVAHTDSRFDPEMLVRYVRAYQEVQPLTIGELWAVAITLADRAGRESQAAGGTDRAQSHVARRRPTILPTGCWARVDTRPNRCRRLLAAYERARLPEAFAVQLVHRLRDQDPRITPALTWLDQQSRGAGNHCRRSRARRTPEAGCCDRHGAQHHHQHALDLRRRLDGVVRAHQPG